MHIVAHIELIAEFSGILETNTVDVSVVIAICFIGFTFAAGTCVLLARDLLVPGRVGAGTSLRPRGKTAGIRRLPTVFDEAPARSFTGRIDQAFDHLVLESGLEIVPLSAFLMLMASGLLMGGLCWSFADTLLAAVGGAVLGMVLPLAYLTVVRSRRLRDVREEFAPVLDMLARAVRAGESLDQAIALVGDEAGGVLGKEFARCSRQMQMGRSVSAVMQSLAARIRLVEMRLLATTLTVQRQTGGSLATTLDRMAAVVRDRLNARRQMRAATGAGRASTILVATICPATYLVMFLWQPEHMRLFYEDPLGQGMLAIAIVLEIIGVFWAIALLRNDS